MTKDNHLLGKFDLTGIPQPEVTSEVDVNDIPRVSAEDKVNIYTVQICTCTFMYRTSEVRLYKLLTNCLGYW